MRRSRAASGERPPRSRSTQASALPTGSAATSAIERPSTVTASISGLSRAPPQSGQGTDTM